MVPNLLQIREWLAEFKLTLLALASFIGALALLLNRLSILKKALRRLLSAVRAAKVLREDKVVEDDKPLALAADEAANDLTRLAREHEERGALLVQDLQKRFRDPGNLAQVVWNANFTQQVALNEGIRRHVEERAKLVIIASGKGGVGKSMLSLGLTETFVNNDAQTLLVDFDLHNRGLTSLFALAGTQDSKTSVYSELGRFDQILLKKGGELLQATNQPPSQLSVQNKLRENPVEEVRKRAEQRRVAIEYYLKDRDGTVELLNAFTKEDKLDRNILGLLGQVPHASNTDSIELPRGKKKLRLAQFLPSLRMEERFLGSSVFEVDFVEIFIFFLMLQYLAGLNGFTRIVVDCHGAHDHLMIGAIHASSALLVVTTPEPGGFDGTYDLMTFAKMLQDKQNKELPTVLVLNNCHYFQQPAVKMIETFLKIGQKKSAIDVNKIIEIPSQRGVPIISSRYMFGDVASQPNVWKGVVEIVDELERIWKQPPPSPPERVLAEAAQEGSPSAPPEIVPLT